MKTKIGIKQIAESSALLALGFVLSMLKFKPVAYGGSVTIVSMLPIVILAFKYGPGWGSICGAIHGLLQIIQDGGLAPPTKDFASFALVVLLDYVLAWGSIGLIAGLIRKVSSKPQISIAAGSFLGLAARFLCSFLSGIIIWGVYAPEGQSVALYSLGYNATYMLPEMLITSVVGYMLFCMPIMQKQVRTVGRKTPEASLR